MFFNHFGWRYESVGIATRIIWIRISFLNIRHAVITFTNVGRGYMIRVYQNNMGENQNLF